ncbi:MAG: hypothetical protein Q8P62_00405 [Candidatus Peregrinibacteria bacterium]|nr:hypothetical protein [Candidatus Peregrinibacteria bacterium]
MKTTQKIFLSLVSLTTILLTTFTVLADTVVLKFTPFERATKSCIDNTCGIDGLSYTSFNSFLKNPNIGWDWANNKINQFDPRAGDERNLLVGKLCKKDVAECTAQNPYDSSYDNKITSLQDGDTLRFSVYYHNNGKDGDSATEAKNVQIGIKLKNDDGSLKTLNNELHPIGVIRANNNTYRTILNDPTKVIKVNGVDLHTATDDIAIEMPTFDFTLEPVAGSIYVAAGEDFMNQQDKKAIQVSSDANNKTKLTFKPTGKPAITSTLLASIDNDKGKMWVDFDRLPGCFRYSGFVYFDVKVVKKPEPVASICSELKVVKEAINEPKLQLQPSYKISATPTFAPTNTVPDTTQIQWSTTDSKGKFWQRIEMAVPGQYKYSDITASGGSSPGALSNPDEEIFYTGYGTVSAKLTGIADNLANPTKCTDKFTLTPPPICTKLEVNYPETVTVGVISDFMAKATITKDDKTTADFQGQIKYWVDNINDGRFYSAPPSEYPYMTQPYKIAFGYTPETLQGEAKKTGQIGTQSVTINQKVWTHFVGMKATGQQVHIKAYDPTGIIDVSKCKLDLPIAPAPSCKEISVNKHSIITEGQVTEFSAIGKDYAGKTFNGKVTYSVPPEYGTFYTDPNDADVNTAKANTSKFTEQYNETQVGDLSKIKPQDGDFCKNPVQLPKDLAPTIAGNPNTIPSALDIILGQMYGTIPLQSIKDIIDIGKFGANGMIDPNTSDLVNPLNPTGETTNPGATNIFGAFGQEKLTQADKAKISGFNQKILQVKAGDPQKGSTIVVDPNTKVYFVPKKGSEGQKVVSVSINCSSNSCSKTFEIISIPKEIPIVCEASGLTVTDMKTNQKVSCLKQGEYLLNTGFYQDKDQKISLAPPKDISVKWESTDPNSLFYDMSSGAPANQNGAKSPFVASLSVKYIGEGQVTSSLIALNGKQYTQKSCSKFIPPCTKNCESLTFTSNGEAFPPNSPGLIAQKDQAIKLSLNTKDNQGNPLPDDTKFNFVWNTNGEVTDSKGTKNTETGKFSTTINNLPLIFSGADKIGQITATVDKSSPLYSEKCKADISILQPEIPPVKPEEPLTCKEISVIDVATNKAPSLAPNGIYQVRAKAQYSKTVIANNTFAVKQGMGVVVSMSSNPLIKSLQLVVLNDLRLSENLTAEGKLKTLFTLLPSQTVADGQTAYLVTYSDVKVSDKEALEVKAEKFSTPADCDKFFPLTYTPPIPKPEPTCDTLSIVKPTSPWTADGMTIDPFEIKVTTTPANKEGEFSYTWETDKTGTWNSTGKTTDKTVGILTNTLKNAEGGTTVKIQALDKTGAKIPKCLATITANPAPPQGTICDSLTLEKPTSPWTANKLGEDDFKIKVETSPQGKESEFLYAWEVNKNGTWTSNGHATDQEKGLLTNTLKNGQDSTTVKIYALKDGKEITKCSTTIKAEPKPANPTICKSLNIKTPKSPWIAKKSTKELFELDVLTDPKSKEKDLTYIWKVTDKKGEWSNGKQEDRTSSLKNSLEDAEDGTTVEVYAQDEDGKKIKECSDTINAKTVRSPIMTKSVYATSPKPTNTTKDILNMGASSSKKLVTYKIQFKANSAEEVDISEKTMSNGIIKGNKNGTMGYKGMIINATEGTGPDAKRTLLKDGNYQTETEDTYFRGHDFKLADLQNQHNCNNGTLKADAICIDNPDFTSVVNRFKDGYAIPFKNIKTNLKNTVIEIKVQMEITNTIDDTTCKGLSTADGCGEEFNNNAKFEATILYGGKENDSVSAKVIVICPYVLTRQAGDVFFYDALSTGIDVSRCSEVKSTPGLVVQPEKKQTTTVTKTGSGDLPDEAKFLSVPSHDICRYSNTGTNVEGYDDVLKNFSSTICEMRAEVAETWKEAYINESIKANVERISRFGQNLKDQNQQISNMTSLQDLDNAQSGVFVKEGGTLTIGRNGTFEINSFALNRSEKVPAGQTYIIKGGTLHIKSDIIYGETTYENPKKIPSAAFIVIDGNIIIDNNVGQIDAIIMAIDTDNSGDGKITNATIDKSGNLHFDENDTSDRKLVINGSLIGNVSELFSTRTGAGDPTKDEGAVTVRYDERILLNTPPGLSDLLNITQSLIP